MTATIVAWRWTTGFSLRVLPLAFAPVVCGAILLVSVWHHLTTPLAMSRTLERAGCPRRTVIQADGDSGGWCRTFCEEL